MSEKTYDTLQVTRVSINPRSSGKYILATANVVLNDQIILRGIKVREGQNGFYVSMPVDRLSTDERVFFDPITKDLRDNIENSVLEAYTKGIT